MAKILCFLRVLYFFPILFSLYTVHCSNPNNRNVQVQKLLCKNYEAVHSIHRNSTNHENDGRNFTLKIGCKRVAYCNETCEWNFNCTTKEYGDGVYMGGIKSFYSKKHDAMYLLLLCCNSSGNGSYCEEHKNYSSPSFIMDHKNKSKIIREVSTNKPPKDRMWMTGQFCEYYSNFSNRTTEFYSTTRMPKTYYRIPICKIPRPRDTVHTVSPTTYQSTVGFPAFFGLLVGLPSKTITITTTTSTTTTPTTTTSTTTTPTTTTSTTTTPTTTTSTTTTPTTTTSTTTTPTTTTSTTTTPTTTTSTTTTPTTTTSTTTTPTTTTSTTTTPTTTTSTTTTPTTTTTTPTTTTSTTTTPTTTTTTPTTTTSTTTSTTTTTPTTTVCTTWINCQSATCVAQPYVPVKSGYTVAQCEAACLADSKCVAWDVSGTKCSLYNVPCSKYTGSNTNLIYCEKNPACATTGTVLRTEV